MDEQPWLYATLSVPYIPSTNAPFQQLMRPREPGPVCWFTTPASPTPCHALQGT